MLGLDRSSSACFQWCRAGSGRFPAACAGPHSRARACENRDKLAPKRKSASSETITSAPSGHTELRAARQHRLAGGLNVQYDLSAADVIVSLDADFLSGASYPGFHKLVRDYAERRKKPENGMNRLYAIESTPTTTGMKAEHRLGLRASEIPAFAAALAAGCGRGRRERSRLRVDRRAEEVSCRAGQGSEGQCGQERGDSGALQDPSVGALAMAINKALGNVGKTVFLSPEPANPIPSDQIGDFKALVADLNAGKVDWLVILNANPIYDAPADLDFATAFDKANIVAHLGSHLDETGQISHWHIPAAHYLEYWSDARAYDGTISIVQPMIDPLYGGRTAHDFFQTLLDDPMVSAYDAVRATWKPTIKGDFETGWRKALHDGWIADTAFDRSKKTVVHDGAASAEYSQRPRRRIRSRSSSGPIPMFMTAAGRTWAGCRSCPSR